MNQPNTIVQAAPLVRAGQLRPLDLVNACLERIDRWDHDIRAWVHIDADGARAAAEQRGQEAASNYRGPLHGIPIGIKDIIDVKGMPTRAGSPLTDSNPVGEDAPVVARLREAGAIILGKTATTEFASFDPAPTRNPWNPNHTPGGSSSGSAAAVAAGMCLAAVGTQTGGSIIRPAAYCGVAGCKPTFGLVPTDGVVPISEHLDHVGAFTRSVSDLAVMLGIMAGEPALTDAAASLASLPAPPRMALIETYFMEQADESVIAATRHALKALAAAGAEIRLTQLPESFAEVHTMHYRLMARGAADVHGQRFAAHRDQFGRHISALIEDGLATRPEACEVALAHQRRFRDEIAMALEEVDAFVTPATITTAPPSLDTTGDPGFNAPWSYSGSPVVSIPCGLDANGLPAGLQLIGRHGRDRELLAVATWCEAQVGFAELPPPLAQHA